MDKVRLSDKFGLFTETFTPKIVGELNDNHILIAKLKGAFVWHTHEEDEFFFVVKGHLRIKLRDREIALEPGELFVVPKGVEHCPACDDEVQLMMIEPKITKHTGDLVTEKTVSHYDYI